MVRQSLRSVGCRREPQTSKLQSTLRSFAGAKKNIDVNAASGHQGRRSLVKPNQFLLRRRRIPAAAPINPVPNRIMLAGSGVWVVGVVPTTPVAGPQVSQMISTAHGEVKVPGGFVEFRTS